MTDSGKYQRTGSGVWKLFEPSTPTPAPRAAPHTPARGLPADPLARAMALAAQARADVARGQWASAEANFRLALHYAPGHRSLEEELKGAIEGREKFRRELAARGPTRRPR